MRDWIADKIGKEYLIPILGIYNKFKEIEFEKLPNQFVIKCNHGRGYNIIVTDKSQLNLTDAKTNVDKWMNENYALHSTLDLQFRDINHKILIEKYINDSSGDLINYELFCFEGKPKLIVVESEQCINHMFNCYKTDYYVFPSLKKHKYLENMIGLASILSEGFIFVRVDFYMINNKIYFNKMEFTTSSRIDDIIPKNIYRDLSSLIKLPKLAFNIDIGEYYELAKSFTVVPYYMILICIICKIFYYLWVIEEMLLMS